MRFAPHNSISSGPIRWLLYVLTISASVCAQDLATVGAPRLGALLDRSGTLHSLYGFGGTFVLGEPLADGVESFACQASGCWIKTKDRILTPDGAIEATQGLGISGLEISGLAISGPVIFSAGGTHVYFQDSGTLARIENDRLIPKPVDRHDTDMVLALGEGSRGVEIALERSGSVVVEDAAGSIVRTFPLAAEPFFLMPNGTAVYAVDAGNTLVMENLDYSRHIIPLSDIEKIFSMGNGYLQVETAAGSYALDIHSTEPALYRLPNPLQSVQRDPANPDRPASQNARPSPSGRVQKPVEESAQ